VWILCKKIKFSTTSAFQIERFKNLQGAINILMIMKFSLIISVMGTHACYHHVVVIWRGMMGPWGTPTTCHNQHGTLRSYSFGQI
jgi:hypothetical protein